MAGPLGGTTGGSDNVHHRVLKMTSMAGPLVGTADGSSNVHHRVLKTTGLDPILCPNILQNRVWKVVIIPVGLVPQATDLRYA
jgi:hypothetical protein